MGLFSSKKSSAVSTTNTVQTTNINAQTSGAGHVIAGSGNNVNVTDGGSVAKALEFADLSNWRALWASDQASARSIASVDQASARALGFALDTQESAAGLTLGLIDRYQSASAATLDKVLNETRSQSKDARDFALSAVRTETQELSRDMLKLGAVAVAVLGVLSLMKG